MCLSSGPKSFSRVFQAAVIRSMAGPAFSRERLKGPEDGGRTFFRLRRGRDVVPRHHEWRQIVFSQLETIDRLVVTGLFATRERAPRENAKIRRHANGVEGDRRTCRIGREGVPWRLWQGGPASGAQMKVLRSNRNSLAGVHWRIESVFDGQIAALFAHPYRLERNSQRVGLRELVFLAAMGAAKVHGRLPRYEVPSAHRPFREGNSHPRRTNLRSPNFRARIACSRAAPAAAPRRIALPAIVC